MLLPSSLLLSSCLLIIIVINFIFIISSTSTTTLVNAESIYNREARSFQITNEFFSERIDLAAFAENTIRAQSGNNDTARSLGSFTIGPNVTFSQGSEFNLFVFLGLRHLLFTRVTCTLNADHYSTILPPNHHRLASAPPSSLSCIEFKLVRFMLLSNFTVEDCRLEIDVFSLKTRNISLFEISNEWVQIGIRTPVRHFFTRNSVALININDGSGNDSNNNSTIISSGAIDNDPSFVGDVAFLRFPQTRASQTIFGDFSRALLTFTDNVVDDMLMQSSKFKIVGITGFDERPPTQTKSKTQSPEGGGNSNGTESGSIVNESTTMMASMNSNENLQVAEVNVGSDENNNDSNQNQTTTTTVIGVVSTSSTTADGTSPSSSSLVPSSTTATSTTDDDSNQTSSSTLVTAETTAVSPITNQSSTITSPTNQTSSMTNFTSSTTAMETSTTTITATTAAPVPSHYTDMRYLRASLWQFNCNPGFSRNAISFFKLKVEPIVYSVTFSCFSETKTLHAHSISKSTRSETFSKSRKTPTFTPNITATISQSKSLTNKVQTFPSPVSKELFDGSSALFILSSPFLGVLGSVPLVYFTAQKAMSIATASECLYYSPLIDQQELDFLDDDISSTGEKQSFYDMLELGWDLNPTRMKVNNNGNNNSNRERFETFRGSLVGSLIVSSATFVLALIVVIAHAKIVSQKEVHNQGRDGTLSSSWMSLMKMSMTSLRLPGYWLLCFVFVLSISTSFSIGALFALPTKSITRLLGEMKTPAPDRAIEVYTAHKDQNHSFNIGMGVLCLFFFTLIPGVTFFFIYKKTKIDVDAVEYETGRNINDALEYDEYFERPRMRPEDKEENILLKNTEYESYSQKSFRCCCCSKSSSSKRNNKQENSDDDDIDTNGSSRSSCGCLSCCSDVLSLCTALLSDGAASDGNSMNNNSNNADSSNVSRRRPTKALSPKQQRALLLKKKKQREAEELEEKKEEEYRNLSTQEHFKYTLLAIFSPSHSWSEKSIFKQRFGRIYEFYTDIRFVILDFIVAFFINMISGITVNCGANDVCCRGSLFFILVFLLIQLIFMTCVWKPFLSKFFKWYFIWTNFLMLIESALGMAVLVANNHEREIKDFAKKIFSEATSEKISEKRLRDSVVAMGKVVQAFAFIALLILITQIIMKRFTVFNDRRQKRAKEKQETEKKKRLEADDAITANLLLENNNNSSRSSPIQKKGSKLSSSASPTSILKNNQHQYHSPDVPPPSAFGELDDDDDEEMKSMLLHRSRSYGNKNDDAIISSTDDEASPSGAMKKVKQQKHVTFYRSPNTEILDSELQPFPKKPKRIRNHQQREREDNTNNNAARNNNSASSKKRSNNNNTARSSSPKKKDNLSVGELDGENRSGAEASSSSSSPKKDQQLLLLHQLRETQLQLKQLQKLRADELRQKQVEKERREKARQEKERIRLASENCVVFMSPSSSVTTARNNNNDDDDYLHYDYHQNRQQKYHHEDDEPHLRISPSQYSEPDEDMMNVPDDDDGEEQLLQQDFSSEDYHRLLFGRDNGDDNNHSRVNDDEDVYYSDVAPSSNHVHDDDDDDGAEDLDEGEEMSLDELEYFTGVDLKKKSSN